ncbi:MAG: DUF1553 domain-containing protein [Prosthecobacter sp.]
MNRRLFHLGLALASAVCAFGEPATFVRGINLNGPSLRIDERPWESGKDAKNVVISGKTFENQKVLLKPPVDAERTRMIRSSVWGNDVNVTFNAVPEGSYQVFLYVWEDNNNERFSLKVNDKVVVEAFESGTEGMWKKLGPWSARPVAGKIKITATAASHGAANLSGIELWKGEGGIPQLAKAGFADEPTAEQLAFFENKIRPVLVEHCYQCHSATAKKIKGGLVVDSRAGVRKGGGTGPLLTPGDPDASLLIEAVRHLTEDTAMPPKKKLSANVIADLEAWVRMGAPDPRATDTVAAVEAKSAINWDKAREWWSLQPLKQPTLPTIKEEKWPAGDVDHFVLAKIEAAGLKPSQDADKRTLIRRATFDLIGLPPTPEEVDAFLADQSDNAFVKEVDRLLDSPAYGERWGRHWLDVVRYADTAGDNSDYPIPQMRRYRDWVIAAFNRDLPYDEFVRDQLAGDLRGGSTDAERYDRIIATGYIGNARRFGSRVDDYPQHLTIEDTIDNLGRTFLGLSLNCARCHDHKFDPVSNEDYYALYGIFNSTRYPWPGIELDKKQRDLVPLVPVSMVADAEAKRAAREKEQTQLRKEADKLKIDLKTASKDQKPAMEAKMKEAQAKLAALTKKPLPFEFAYAVADAKKVGDSSVQQKGDPAKPGAIVPRRFLTVFGGQKLPTNESSSGRAQLAEWILSDNNPLTARVMANRIWQHHFGRGIVPTPNDFGKQGRPATNPELLDFLAVKFREGGWSMKAMHRLIMLSRTYRMSSERDESSIAADPTNEHLSSFPRLRLDAESIRDTLLLLGGNLDTTPAGEHPFPPQNEWNFTQHNAFKAVYPSNHRSVYLMTQRIQRHPYLAIFDGADPSASTAARPTSTTPLQALFLLNDPLVHEQAGLIADRLIRHASDSVERVKFAYQLLFARPPSSDELQAATRFLADAGQSLPEGGKNGNEAWNAYVRVLLRLNEFVYID